MGKIYKIVYPCDYEELNLLPIRYKYIYFIFCECWGLIGTG